MFGIQTKPIETAKRSFAFPKTARILRSCDFRKVYSEGVRVASPYFAAFCRRNEEQPGSRIGFTVPRALGKSVVRNRLKRRVREAVRRQFSQLPPHWEIVINPRRAALTADFGKIEGEVGRLFSQCKG